MKEKVKPYMFRGFKQSIHDDIKVLQVLSKRSDAFRVPEALNRALELGMKALYREHGVNYEKERGT